MSDIENKKEQNILTLEKGKNNRDKLLSIESALIKFIGRHNLPTENIFSPVEERGIVFKNIEYVVDKIDVEMRKESIYISKFIGAVISGLFDAALNYLWDETILHIRKKVIQYDINYFYDSSGLSEEKRKRLKSQEDITELSDYELIKGAKGIGLISEIGFRHLDYIKYMRNHASAAHPNQNEITGLNLIDWLDTCIKEVISLPILNNVLKIQELLSNIKENEIDKKKSEEISSFFEELDKQKVNKLLSGFWGIYTDIDTKEEVRKNVILLLPKLWEYSDEEIRNELGLKYGHLALHNYKEKKNLADQFLKKVNGENYIPNNLRVLNIKKVLNGLLVVHNQINNFYNEPTFIRNLQNELGDPLNVPKEINQKYVITLIHVYLTNGNGVCYEAEPIYVNLIENFDENQSSIAVCSFIKTEIDSKLQFKLCRDKFINMLKMVKEKIINKEIIRLIEKIDDKHQKNGILNLKEDKKIKGIVDSLRIINK